MFDKGSGISPSPLPPSERRRVVIQDIQVNFRMTFSIDRVCGHGEMVTGTQFSYFTVAKVQNTDTEGVICVRFECVGR